jgi:CheY-like chemotaxis protein/HPt (histidine-containing phosphotransfer) domain-containing protein
VQQTLKGIHLLVAEDNEMNQFVTREILKRSGCTCDVVADGQLAVDAAQRERYDAILMDCRMPGMDGLAATRRIRELEAAIPGSPRIPIIALTAEAVTGDRDKCLEAGMDGYVSKPIDAKLLVAAIESMVRHPRPHPPTTAESTQSPGSANSPAAIAADPPIDVRALLGRCLSDAAFACKTLELFEQRALGDVDRLHESLVEHDSRKVNNLAHNLKAVAAHVGAMKLKNIAFEIEQAGAQQNLEFVEQQLTELAAEARRCAAFIPDAIQRLVHPEPADPSVKPSR